jgi:hypothetical protein
MLPLATLPCKGQGSTLFFFNGNIRFFWYSYSYVRITFKYTGCAIFFNLEKHNESNCTKKIICCYLKNLSCPWTLVR